jgi:hypothetical protein
MSRVGREDYLVWRKLPLEERRLLLERARAAADDRLLAAKRLEAARALEREALGRLRRHPRAHG